MGSLKQHVNKDHGKESKEYKHFESNVETTETYKKKGNKKVVVAIPKPRFYGGIYDHLPRIHRRPVSFLEKPEPENKCILCDEKFDNFFKLVEHKKRYVDGNEWVCPEEGCTTRYSGTSNHRPLDGHLKGHRGELEFSCEKCGKKFPSKFLLDTHMKTHVASLELRCDLCPKRLFRTVPNLREHMKHRHENPIKIGCEICGRQFWKDLRTRFRNHMSKHEGKTSYFCSICPKKYFTSATLSSHKKWSHDIGEKKWFKCSYCAKDFRSNCKLKEHEQIHTGDKAFKCSICGKQFVQKANLKAHNQKCKPSS